MMLEHPELVRWELPTRSGPLVKPELTLVLGVWVTLSLVFYMSIKLYTLPIRV